MITCARGKIQRIDALRIWAFSLFNMR